MLPHHLRVALRRLAGTPGFTALTVSTLALAVGANVAIFSLVNALFLRPLPVAEPERLAGVYQSRDGQGFFPVSLPDARDVERWSEVFGGVAAHYPTAPLSLRVGREGQEEVNGSVVSADYFELLGVEPARGRFFRPEEGTTPGAHPVAVISHRLWQGRLGGRADVVGTVLEVNGVGLTVVGVAPPGFGGVLRGQPSHLWLPASMARLGYRWCDALDRGCTWLTLIGRLAAGRTVEEAEAEMAVLARRLRSLHPDGDTERGLTVAPLSGLHPAARADTQRLAGLLLAAVTLVVLVAGANLGGLLLARGLGRGREVAVRLALGAGRRHAVAGFLAETLLLALAGGAGGVLLAVWFGRLVAAVYPSREPLPVAVDATVVVYALLLCLLAGLLLGLVPGLRATRPDLLPALDGGDARAGGRRSRLLTSLVVVQVALSFVLLAGTGLLARSLGSATGVGGLDPESLVTVRLRPRLAGYGPGRAQEYTRRVVERLEALPGVRSVSPAAGLPPFPFFGALPVGEGDEGRGLEVWSDEIGPGMLDTLGIPLLRGRAFDRRDVVGGAHVVVVNRLLADALWPDRPAVGERLLLGGRAFEVVGVFDDRAWRHLTREPLLRAYTPYWQGPDQVDARLWVRTDGDGSHLLPRIADTLRAIDPAVPVTETGTLADRLDRHLAPVHLAGRVLAASGVLALLLSAVGLFGVLALAVAQRRREIGIRMALGSDRAGVVALVYRDAMLMVAAALALGLAAALLAGRTLDAWLYGVGPRDPLALTAAALLLALVASLATWWPAHRASRLDPLETLRQG